jgi:hypothetical protein
VGPVVGSVGGGHDGAVRSPSFWLLLLVSTLSTCGYALLLSVVPLWVSSGGSGAFGAGLSTAVFMLATVATQLVVPALMRRFGPLRPFGASLVLLGAPAPLLALSPGLGPVLGLAVLRGIGFGLFTVVSNAIVPALVPPAEHGRATARYGTAVGIPQLVLLPAGVALAGQVGFPLVFALGAAPLLGLLPLPFIHTRRPLPAAEAPADPGPALVEPAPADPGPALVEPAPAEPGLVEPALAEPATTQPAVPVHDRAAGIRTFARPLLAMVTSSMAQGGLITFLPLTPAGAGGGLAVPVALLGTTTGSLVGRLVSGQLVDRRGLGGRLLRPGMLLAGLGMVAELPATGSATPASAALLTLGALAVGVGFGLVQNDTLTSMFAAGGPAGYGRASAAWNAAYDTGTGVGALGLGALAQPFGFGAAFGACAVLLGLALLRLRRS